MNPKKKQNQTKSESISELRGQNIEGTDTLNEALVADLASHNDAARVKARQSLVAMGRTAVPLLIEALKNKNNLTRWEAAKALGEIGDPGTAPALVEVLEDEDFDVRWLTAEGLIKMNINALKPLLQALEKRGDSFFASRRRSSCISRPGKRSAKKISGPGVSCTGEFGTRGRGTVGSPA